MNNFGLRDPAIVVFLLSGIFYIVMGLSNSIGLIGLMRFLQGMYALYQISKVDSKKLFLHDMFIFA